MEELRKVIINAEDVGVITKEETGFIITLAKKFRSEIDKKVKQINIIQGEVIQLKNNERTITDLINNFILAEKRRTDIETFDK